MRISDIGFSKLETGGLPYVSFRNSNVIWGHNDLFDISTMVLSD